MQVGRKGMVRVNAQHRIFKAFMFGFTVSLGMVPAVPALSVSGHCEMEVAPEGDATPLEMPHILPSTLRTCTADNSGSVSSCQLCLFEDSWVTPKTCSQTWSLLSAHGPLTLPHKSAPAQ